MKDPGLIQEKIAGEVRAEVARQNASQTELAKWLGLHQTGVSKRLQGRIPFSAAELLLVADFFDVPVNQFYAARNLTPSPDGTPAYDNGTTRWDGAGRKRAMRDSNPQPSDP